jgi:hypothetical protein
MLFRFSVHCDKLDGANQAFMRSGRPLLLRSGVPEAVVDELQSNAEREMIEAHLSQYIRVQSVYARKKQN